MAGLLAFPGLLYLPDFKSVALYEQASLMGITAAGTVPDSHRIPLHHGGFCPQIAFVGAKVRISEQTAKEKCVFLLFFRAKVPSTVAKGTNDLSISHQFPNYFVLLRHEIAISHCSAYLDTFMATPEHVRELFAHYGADADVGIVEDMMGLFDGYDRL